MPAGAAETGRIAFAFGFGGRGVEAWRSAAAVPGAGVGAEANARAIMRDGTVVREKVRSENMFVLVGGSGWA